MGKTKSRPSSASSGPRRRWASTSATWSEQVADLFAKRHGIMVNSGSSANYLAIEILGLPRGSEVITPALTFATTVAPIVRAGLIPAFVDTVPGTYVIDVDAIEAMITPRTRALMIPSLIGNLPDWDQIRAIADAHGLIVIEDSADTLGATLDGAQHRHPLRHQHDQLLRFSRHHGRRQRRHDLRQRGQPWRARRCCCGPGAARRRCTSSPK